MTPSAMPRFSRTDLFASQRVAREAAETARREPGAVLASTLPDAAPARAHDLFARLLAAILRGLRRLPADEWIGAALVIALAACIVWAHFEYGVPR